MNNVSVTMSNNSRRTSFTKEFPARRMYVCILKNMMQYEHIFYPKRKEKSNNCFVTTCSILIEYLLVCLIVL